VIRFGVILKMSSRQRGASPPWRSLEVRKTLRRRPENPSGHECARRPPPRLALDVVAQLRTRADQLVAVSPRLAGGRVATVVSGPSEYGIQRMTQAYVDDGVKHARAVFYTLDDARAWLRHQ
jgi:hypothetical protein